MNAALSSEARHQELVRQFSSMVVPTKFQNLVVEIDPLLSQDACRANWRALIHSIHSTHHIQSPQNVYTASVPPLAVDASPSTMPNATKSIESLQLSDDEAVRDRDSKDCHRVCEFLNSVVLGGTLLHLRISKILHPHH